jgi:hypothetical protein
MSTDGTLFDETIKLGYAKHLQTQNIPGGTVYAVFLAPFTTFYDTLMFEFVNVASTVDACIMGWRVSYDGGASFSADGYWWTQQYNFSYHAGGSYGSCSISQPDYVSYAYAGANPVNTHPSFGELYLQRSSRPFLTWDSHVVHIQSGLNFISCRAGGMHVGTGAGVAANPVNGIHFFFAGSSFKSGSIIRCFGIKKGIIGS